MADHRSASLAPQKYTERLGVIDPEQLFAVAEAFDLGEVLDAHAPSGGLFGQNLIISASKGEFVLRGNPFGHVQLTKERRVADFIDQGSSLAAPWPYVVCDDPSLFGWTYAIMPRLPGKSGTDLWATADDDGKLALARATGEALAQLHEADSDFFGPYDAQLDDFLEMDDFREWALHRLEHWRQSCRAVNALSTEAERYIDRLLEECADALDEPFTPLLVHHDFKHQNLNFEAKDSRFVATGVFDLFEAYLADGEEDLVRMLWLVDSDDQRSAFVDAYVAHWPLRRGAEQRLVLYALSDWLVIWEYHARVGGVEEATFMRKIKPIVAKAREIGSGA